jgi:hypothetical protein
MQWMELGANPDVRFSPWMQCPAWHGRKQAQIRDEQGVRGQKRLRGKAAHNGPAE